LFGREIREFRVDPSWKRIIEKRIEFRRCCKNASHFRFAVTPPRLAKLFRVGYRRTGRSVKII